MSRKNTKADAAFERANDLLRNAKIEPSSVLQDSGVFFLRWFAWLLSLDTTNFIIATIAVFCNIFFGVDIADWGLPEKDERAVETFVPTIKKNRANRLNGPKGGPFGDQGPRKKKEKNAAGVNSPDPGGVNNPPPNDNVMEPASVTDTENENKSDDDEVGYISQSDLHQQYGYLYPIFFFMNFLSPSRQLERFVSHYSKTGWTMSGGDTATSREERIALAKRWRDKEDPCCKYKKEDLDMWHSLYQIASGSIREKMLHPSPVFTPNNPGGIHIACASAVSKWIKTNLEASQIIEKWRMGKPVEFIDADSKCA